MDQETQKIIQEQMKLVPEDIALAIISVEYQAKLQEVVKRQKLMIDQAGKLEMETTLVMIGLEPLSDFINNIQREMEISAVRANEIATDVNENIFKPVRASLQRMNSDLEDTEEKAGEEITEEQGVTKFTNSNETELNRDQILNEIENPVLNHPVINTAPISKTEIEIRPNQELKTIPGEGVKDIPANIVEAKMTSTTNVTKQVISVKPESKLPEITPKAQKVDPYREPLI